MSAIINITLFCDGPRCDAQHDGQVGQQLRTVRRDAERGGWRYVPGHPTVGTGRDLCPDHARKASS